HPRERRADVILSASATRQRRIRRESDGPDGLIAGAFTAQVARVTFTQPELVGYRGARMSEAERPRDLIFSWLSVRVRRRAGSRTWTATPGCAASSVRRRRR